MVLIEILMEAVKPILMGKDEIKIKVSKIISNFETPTHGTKTMIHLLISASEG